MKRVAANFLYFNGSIIRNGGIELEYPFRTFCITDNICEPAATAFYDGIICPAFSSDTPQNITQALWKEQQDSPQKNIFDILASHCSSLQKKQIVNKYYLLKNIDLVNLRFTANLTIQLLP